MSRKYIPKFPNISLFPRFPFPNNNHQKIAKGTTELGFKPKPKFSLKILNKVQFQNLDQKLASECWRKICFKFLTKLYLNTFIPQYLDKYSGSKSRPKCCQNIPYHQHQQHYQLQEVLSWDLQKPETHQPSLLNSSQ